MSVRRAADLLRVCTHLLQPSVANQALALSGRRGFAKHRFTHREDTLIQDALDERFGDENMCGACLAVATGALVSYHQADSNA